MLHFNYLVFFPILPHLLNLSRLAGAMATQIAGFATDVPMLEHRVRYHRNPVGLYDLPAFAPAAAASAVDIQSAQVFRFVAHFFSFRIAPRMAAQMNANIIY